MKPHLPIPLYREINECNEATGFPVRTDLPEFHIFTLAETASSTRLSMPPYRRGFYQISYLEPSGDAIVRLESETFTGKGNVLLFAAPEHVLSWVRGEPQDGFIVYFKAEFLTNNAQPLDDAFPFLGRFDVNVLSLEPADHLLLRPQLQRLHALFRSTHPYRRPQLAALTNALLYDCRALYDKRKTSVAERPVGNGLATRFQQLVWRCFQNNPSVEEYARCLHVSADHLSATVKEHTGRNAREIIADRVVFEARRLLTYTELNVSEIAEHLQFSEPTHFARFFKRHTQHTPLEFRQGANRAVAKHDPVVAVGA